MKIIYKHKAAEAIKIIKLKYTIKTKEQAAYETIMQGSDLLKVFFFILIKPEINWSVIHYIIRSWDDKEIWFMAFRFAEAIGIDNLGAYNAGIFPEKKIPISLDFK